MLARKWMWIGWPAFLAAGLMEILVFGLVDPQDLHWLGHQPLDLSSQGIYTLAFFAFWLVSYVACSLTLSLATQPVDDLHPASPAHVLQRHERGSCC